MFEKELSNALAVDGLTVQDVENALETPKEAKLGDICLPCFKFARTMHIAPPAIAQKLLPRVESLPFVEKVEVVGGYLNVFLTETPLLKWRLRAQTMTKSDLPTKAQARRFA